MVWWWSPHSDLVVPKYPEVSMSPPLRGPFIPNLSGNYFDTLNISDSKTQSFGSLNECLHELHNSTVTTFPLIAVIILSEKVLKQLFFSFFFNAIAHFEIKTKKENKCSVCFRARKHYFYICNSLRILGICTSYWCFIHAQRKAHNKRQSLSCTSLCVVWNIIKLRGQSPQMMDADALASLLYPFISLCKLHILCCDILPLPIKCN